MDDLLRRREADDARPHLREALAAKDVQQVSELAVQVADDGDGGAVVLPAKIKMHAGPQLPGGVIIAENGDFQTFET